MAEIGRRRRPSVPALVALADVDDLGPIVGGRQLFDELVDDGVRVVVVPVEFVPEVLSISRRSCDIRELPDMMSTSEVEGGSWKSSRSKGC